MFSVLYQDDAMIVVEKPVGMLSEYKKSEKSLPYVLAEQENLPTLHTVHRLDQVVGGIILYAKNADFASKLSCVLQNHTTCHKEYTAILDGEIAPADGELQDLLFHDQRLNKTFVAKKMRKGVKEAHLTYRTISVKTSGEKKQALVSVRLFTGRTHQIRVQFANQKAPLLGDGKYGSKTNAPSIALWATRLAFLHPVTQEKMVFSSLPPRVMPWTLF